MTTRSLLYTRASDPQTGGTAGAGPTPARGPSRAPEEPSFPGGLPTPSSVLGRASGENFKVASWLLSAGERRALIAIYGFARLVDELGDSYSGDRMAALQWLESEVRRGVESQMPPGLHPLVQSITSLVAAGQLSAQPLYDLITANRMDQEIDRYPSFDDLLRYCSLSANPVGRLVLEAFDRATLERIAWSDSICTGLQLVEHWQDVREDALAGRVYLPMEDLDRFGVDRVDLASAGPAPAELRGLMAFQIARARRYLDAGFPLIASLSGRTRLAVAGFWAGGHAALDALAAQDFDPLVGAARPAKTRTAMLVARAVLR